jgi:hypothetical protein
MPIATTSLPFLGEFFNRIIINVYNLSLCHGLARMTEVRQECQYATQIVWKQAPARHFGYLKPAAYMPPEIFWKRRGTAAKNR